MSHAVYIVLQWSRLKHGSVSLLVIVCTVTPWLLKVDFMQVL